MGELKDGRFTLKLDLTELYSLEKLSKIKDLIVAITVTIPPSYYTDVDQYQNYDFDVFYKPVQINLQSVKIKSRVFSLFWISVIAAVGVLMVWSVLFYYRRARFLKNQINFELSTVREDIAEGTIEVDVAQESKI